MGWRSVPGFECVALHVRHGIESCVARHTRHEDPTCKRCPIGTAHAAGKLPTHWPAERGARPIVRLVVTVYDRIPLRRRRRPNPSQ